MAGPNPYKLHSFRELRAIMGRAWVVCRPCLRFVELRAGDDRDTRATTFGCCLCGREGQLSFDDPAKQGLEYDPRSGPRRHPDRVIRLQQIARLHDPVGHRKTTREDLPQHEKPRREPEPRYRLKPMPFSTLGELARLGLVLEVWCSTCKSSRPVAVGERLAARRFGRARFTCRAERYDGAICGGLGHPHVVPTALIGRGVAFVSLNCPRCVPPWSASAVQLDAPPWSTAPIDTAIERYRCPACGGQVRMTFHGITTRGGSRSPSTAQPSDLT